MNQKDKTERQATFVGDNHKSLEKLKKDAQGGQVDPMMEAFKDKCYKRNDLYKNMNMNDFDS